MSILYACLARTVDLVDLRGAGICGVRLRRKGSGAVREVGARVCWKGIPEQDQSCPEQRHRCRAAAQPYACVLWLLRLAFFGARTLAAGKTAAHVPKRIVCGGGAR